jgi:primosomal protein N'
VSLIPISTLTNCTGMALEQTLAEQKAVLSEELKAKFGEQAIEADEKYTKEDHKKFSFLNPQARFVRRSELSEDRIYAAERYVGETFLFPRAICLGLSALGLLSKRQGFQYTRSPYTMLRESSGLAYRALLGPHVSGLRSTQRRVIIAGKEGSGKTWILLQMAAMALKQGYIVIAVPQGGPSLFRDSF